MAGWAASARARSKSALAAAAVILKSDMKAMRPCKAAPKSASSAARCEPGVDSPSAEGRSQIQAPEHKAA